MTNAAAHYPTFTDNVYGEITDEYRCDEFRAVVQPPQPPPVGNMDTLGVWTLAWDDFVANGWAEAFPDRQAAVRRLAELVASEIDNTQLTPYREFLDFVMGTDQAIAFTHRHFVKTIEDQGLGVEVEGDGFRVYYPNEPLGLPVLHVQPGGDTTSVQVFVSGMSFVTFHQRQSIDEQLARQCGHLMGAFVRSLHANGVSVP